VSGVRATRCLRVPPDTTPARVDWLRAGEAPGGERARAAARAARSPAGGGCRAGAAGREAEAVAGVGRGAELRRVVAEAEPEAARAGAGAVLLTRSRRPGRGLWPRFVVRLLHACLPCMHGSVWLPRFAFWDLLRGVAVYLSVVTTIIDFFFD
jgi:hypothetical protein